MMTMESTIKRALNQLVSFKKAVWDFVEQQQNLYMIVQDRKINELSFYLSLLNLWDCVGKNHSLNSHLGKKKAPLDLNKYMMKQFLKRELENKANIIAKELDSLSRNNEKGGENLKTFERMKNWEVERRFCSKGKVYFYH